MAKIKVGPGLEDGNEMGPLITREHRDRVASYVANAAAEGATVAVDGRERSGVQARTASSSARRCSTT